MTGHEGADHVNDHVKKSDRDRHHPGIVNSQKYLCNPSSDIEIKWLHRNFDEALF